TPPRAFLLHRNRVEPQNLPTDPGEMNKTFARFFLAPQTISLFAILAFMNLAVAYGASTFPCAGSMNVSRFRLLVQPAKGGTPLPLEEINILEAGEKVKYEPLHLAPAIRDKAKVALLVVAAPKAVSRDEAKGKAEKGNGDEEKE